VTSPLRAGNAKKGATMASEDEVWVQLATRIPKQLHRELKLHCVKADVSLMDFVVSALEDKLQRETRSRVRGRGRS
jgi:predicted HicB family RNase H-like nuclease